MSYIRRKLAFIFNFRVVNIAIVLSQPVSSWNQTPSYSDFENFDQNTNVLILQIKSSEAPLLSVVSKTIILGRYFNKVGISNLYNKIIFKIHGMSSSRDRNRTNQRKRGVEIFWLILFQIIEKDAGGCGIGNSNLKCIGERGNAQD